MHSQSSSVVHVECVTKSFGSQRVVDAISFDIQRGEFCGILGPNGAGKTTLLKMLAGASPPTDGAINVLGFAIPARARQMRARLGTVPQTDNLDRDFSVAENLAVYGGYFGLSARQSRAELPRLLGLVGLEDKAKAKITELSGGMKRRLSIARALINRPDLLILDEPTTGLDPQVRQNIWQILRGLHREGLTIILTTHYMDEAERLCDRIILMDRGRVLKDQSPGTLIREHIEPHVLEVEGAEACRWLDEQALPEGIRCEKVGEGILLYGANLIPLVESVEHCPGLTYRHRPANLEDVFLRLTGRELQDA